MRTFVLLKAGVLFALLQSPAHAETNYVEVICQGVETNTCLGVIEQNPLTAMNAGLQLAIGVSEQIQDNPDRADVRAFADMFAMNRDDRVDTLMSSANTRGHKFFMFYEPSMIIADLALEQMEDRRDRLQVAFDEGACQIGVCEALTLALRKAEGNVEQLSAAIHETENELRQIYDSLQTLELASAE